MLQELNKIKYQIENMENQRTQLVTAISQLESQLQEKDKEMQGILEARQFYKKAVDIVYERSVLELKDILNTALTYAFTGRDFEMDIQISDKRGKSLSFIIKENGHPVNLKTGMGMGVKCVISAVLQMYYLQCQNSKILLLDEAYSNISKSYVPNFFDFLRQMCEKLGFTIIIITHDERFLNMGDKTYIFNEGIVTEDETT